MTVFKSEAFHSGLLSYLKGDLSAVHSLSVVRICLPQECLLSLMHVYKRVILCACFINSGK